MNSIMTAVCYLTVTFCPVWQIKRGRVLNLDVRTIWAMSVDGSHSVITGLTLGSDFRGSFQLGSRSAKVLMRTDADGDDNEISKYQLLMTSLACQLQSGDCMCVCTVHLSRGSLMLNSENQSDRHHPSTSLFQINKVFKGRLPHEATLALDWQEISCPSLRDSPGNFVQLLCLHLTCASESC